jgi:hypothetical protein
VFGAEDFDSLVKLPFGRDMQKIQDTISKLTGVEVTDATKTGAETEQPDVGSDVSSVRAEEAGSGNSTVEPD